MRDFDPYRKWLGIPAKDQPPNYYRLLGLELFESDPELIEGAADKQMSHVRQYQSGQHAGAAAQLLNELATARLCLLKPSAKKEYDSKLRSELKRSSLSPNKQILIYAATGIVVIAALLSIYRTLNPLPEKPQIVHVFTETPTPMIRAKRPPQPPPAPPKPEIPKLKAEIIREWQGRLGSSQEGVFSEDGTRIVYSDGNEIVVEDTVVGSQEIKLSGHTKQVWVARFTPDNKHIVSFGQDATIRRWNRETGAVIAQSNTRSSDQGTVLLSSPDGSRVAFSSMDDKWLDIKNVDFSGTSHQLSGFGDRWFRSVTPDLNQNLQNGFQNNSTISTITPASIVEVDDGHHNYCGQFSPDGEHVLVAGGSDWDLWNVSRKEKLKEGSVIDGHIYAICINKTLNRIAMGVSDGSVWLWGGETAKRLEATTSHAKPVKSVMLSPDSTQLISCDESGKIILWQLPSMN